MAIALASAGPIQMGSTREPSFSRRITTGVLVVRSRPRWATVTSIMRRGPPSARFRSRPGVPTREVLDLLRRERIDDDAHALELEARGRRVHRDRQAMYRLRERLPFLRDHLGGQRLV